MHSSQRYDDSRSDVHANSHIRHRRDDVDGTGVENGCDEVAGSPEVHRREAGVRRGGRSGFDDERDRSRKRHRDTRHSRDPELDRDTVPEAPRRSHHHRRPTTANRPGDFGPPISSIPAHEDRLTDAVKLSRPDFHSCILLMNHLRQWVEECPDIRDFTHHEGRMLVGISSVVLDVLSDMVTASMIENPNSTATRAQVQCLRKWQGWFGEFSSDIRCHIGPRHRVARAADPPHPQDRQQHQHTIDPAHTDDELDTYMDHHSQPPQHRHNSPDNRHARANRDAVYMSENGDRREREQPTVYRGQDDEQRTAYRRRDVEDGYGNGNGCGRVVRERGEEGNRRLGEGRPGAGRNVYGEREMREEYANDGRGGRDNTADNYHIQHGDVLDQAPRAASDPPCVCVAGRAFSRAPGDVQQRRPPTQTHQQQQQQLQQRAAPTDAQPTPTRGPTILPSPPAGIPASIGITATSNGASLPHNADRSDSILGEQQHEIADQQEVPVRSPDVVSSPEAAEYQSDSDISDCWSRADWAEYRMSQSDWYDEHLAWTPEYEEHGVAIPPSATAVAVPEGWLGADDIEARFPEGTNDATKQLAVGLISRTITDVQEATDLIRHEQEGADPCVMIRLRKKGSSTSSTEGIIYPLLSLVIDNKSDHTIPTVQAQTHDNYRGCPVALPLWPDGLEEGMITAVIDGGADLTGGSRLSWGIPRYQHPDIPSEWPHTFRRRPLRVAIASINQPAFELLMRQSSIRVDMFVVLELPRMLRPLLPEYQEVLLSMYRTLVHYDATLATEQDGDSMLGNLVHMAAQYAQGHCASSFINSYLDLITQHGADIAAYDQLRQKPLDRAIEFGSPIVADYLCRKLPAAEINSRAQTGSINGTPIFADPPLVCAADALVQRSQQLQAANLHLEDDQRSSMIKTTIHSLLKAGADISLMPTASLVERHKRQLILTEYTAVLNELRNVTMAAVNRALGPQRSLAALLTPLLAVRPLDVFAWRIASYLFDMDNAMRAIREGIGLRHTDMADRVHAAAEHFVRSALRANSNQEVVGVVANVGGRTVRVPLQCFAVRRQHDGQHRLLGLREVVHRARLDEADRHGVTGVEKDFNTHLGDADCQFHWQQLGYMDDDAFVSLGLT
ncbi:unnamed protein product [Vitrella brassicaformis CCMP3155]|uniref:Uncharacterized protein n=5 Tax=Vitrella brassicaformis TaxID=1169539 RepID=A0A0G4EAP6_VITBC|nr:unnamed protein product [Vitrella brassicaformis CCMP3155]|eukprot:CEL92721.1 unnamed protein product [Vitrella brassicaformis CCMP3155]